MTAPRRVGDTVLRRPAQHNPLADAALRAFDRHGWPGAPRLLRVDDEGWQTVSFVPGEVPWRAPVPGWALTDAALTTLARLVREFHDLTARTGLAGDGRVLCHHDLCPANTVYRDTSSGRLPVVFIDWDIAGSGRRIEDVAHVCWQWLDLGPAVVDVEQAARRIRLIATAYGLADGAALLPTVLWWQERCWSGIERAAAAGEPAMQRLARDGVPERIRAGAAVDGRAHRLAWTSEPLTAGKIVPVVTVGAGFGSRRCWARSPKRTRPSSSTRRSSRLSIGGRCEGGWRLRWAGARSMSLASSPSSAIATSR